MAIYNQNRQTMLVEGGVGILEHLIPLKEPASTTTINHQLLVAEVLGVAHTLVRGDNNPCSGSNNRVIRIDSGT